MRVIDPVRPMLPTVMTELADVPETTLAGVIDPADIVKSGLTMTEMLCDEDVRLPLVPVTITE